MVYRRRVLQFLRKNKFRVHVCVRVCACVLVTRYVIQKIWYWQFIVSVYTIVSISLLLFQVYIVAFFFFTICALVRVTFFPFSLLLLLLLLVETREDVMIYYTLLKGIYIYSYTHIPTKKGVYFFYIFTLVRKVGSQQRAWFL